MTTTLADVSEFQENIDAPAYLGAGHTLLIVRAHNGWRQDRKWPARRDYLRSHPFDALGFYQYLVAGRPPVTQAREFIAAVGDIRPNEFVILDHEEGATSGQAARAAAWFGVVDARYGRPSTLYSGDSFGRTNLGGWVHWRGRPRWIADYRSAPPPDPHELWQNTDVARFPGVSGLCDGNIFDGTPAQFLRTFCHMTPGPTPAPHPPLPKPIKEGTVITAAVKPDGRIELFYEANDGEILHTWQSAPNAGWAGGQAGKRFAGWQSLGHPQKDRM